MVTKILFSVEGLLSAGEHTYHALSSGLPNLAREMSRINWSAISLVITHCVLDRLQKYEKVKSSVTA